jgi:hypothetical protein
LLHREAIKNRQAIDPVAIPIAIPVAPKPTPGE